MIAVVTLCKYCIHYNFETKGCKRNPSVEAWQEDDFCKYGEANDEYNSVYEQELQEI